MKLSKYTKLNKLLATYSVKSKELLHCRRDKRSSGDRMPQPEVSTRDCVDRACLLAHGWCSWCFLQFLAPSLHCGGSPVGSMGDIFGALSIFWHLVTRGHLLKRCVAFSQVETTAGVRGQYQLLLSGPWNSSCSTALRQSWEQPASAAENLGFNDKVQLYSCASNSVMYSWFALKQYVVAWLQWKIYCLFVSPYTLTRAHTHAHLCNGTYCSCFPQGFPR